MPRREWLEWVGWTSAFAGVIAEDKTELHNLEDLQRRLETALKRIQPPPADAVASPAPEANGVELFVDALLLQNGQTALRAFDNTWVSTDGKKLFVPGKPVAKCPPEMQSALKSVLTKLQTEFKGDIAGSDSDLQQLGAGENLIETATWRSTLSCRRQTAATLRMKWIMARTPLRFPMPFPAHRPTWTPIKRLLRQAQAERDKQTRDLATIEQALQSLTPMSDIADNTRLTSPENTSPIGNCVHWARNGMRNGTRLPAGKPLPGLCRVRPGLPLSGRKVIITPRFRIVRGGAVTWRSQLCCCIRMAAMRAFVLCPEGPVLPWEDTGRARSGLRLLIAQARELAVQRGALGLRIEPHLSPPRPSLLRNWSRAPD